MSEYELALLGAVVVLIVSFIVGFSAFANTRPLALPLLFFVIGGGLLYYATVLEPGGDLLNDIPQAFYSLFAKIMN